MCDTAVVVLPGRVLFAKNSDRDPNEAQILDWQPRRQYPAGAHLRCTWLEIPQVPETHAVLLSRPFWMWGAEMGANEHGVVIGNEAVFTRDPVPRLGLTGMDLLRLALERATSAQAAVETITGLLAQHPQGGGCGHEQPSFRYHSSFLVADRCSAYVLETSGQRWQAERVRGARTISNGLTLAPLSRRSQRLRTIGARAQRRRRFSQRAAEAASGPGDLMRLLRSHGPGGGAPRFNFLTGAMGAPCVHAGGRFAASQTTGSWVAELSPESDRHWVTATAAPCTSLFKPVRVGDPLDLGASPTDRAEDSSLWWRHEQLHRQAMRDPERLLARFAAERDAVEARWLVEPPEPAKAFAEGERLLARWMQRVGAQPVPDRRPAWLRHYWQLRDSRSRGAGDTR